MTNTATRLITLIMLLQRQPNQKAPDLAKELGVSIRSLHRYMSMLDELGIPVYSERGPHGGFSLVRGYKIPPLVFTPEEAVAVYLGTSMVDELWGRLYRDAAHGALAKLDNVLPNEQRHEIAWARRTLIATGMHRGDQAAVTPILEKLRRATRERRRVQLTYRAYNRPEATERTFDPYALVHGWGWWYIIGYCHLRQAHRSFRVDRIVEITLLDETFEMPADFDIHAYLARNPTEQRLITVRLRFKPELKQLALSNRSLWETLEEQPDGSIVVTMTNPDALWASSIVLSFGPAVEILEPEEVKHTVVEWAQAVIDQARSAT
jgi:predicted DNA-binding transcriptional regulator YafY